MFHFYMFICNKIFRIIKIFRTPAKFLNTAVAAILVQHFTVETIKWVCKFKEIECNSLIHGFSVNFRGFRTVLSLQCEFLTCNIIEFSR